MSRQRRDRRYYVLKQGVVFYNNHHPGVFFLTAIEISSPKKRKRRWGSYGTSSRKGLDRAKLKPAAQSREGMGC
jgi:hypothetical protein